MPLKRCHHLPATLPAARHSVFIGRIPRDVQRHRQLRVRRIPQAGRIRPVISDILISSRKTGAVRKMPDTKSTSSDVGPTSRRPSVDCHCAMAAGGGRRDVGPTRASCDQHFSVHRISMGSGCLRLGPKSARKERNERGTVRRHVDNAREGEAPSEP